jgi:hypothetical protein
MYLAWELRSSRSCRLCPVAKRINVDRDLNGVDDRAQAAGSGAGVGAAAGGLAGFIIN